VIPLNCRIRAPCRRGRSASTPDLEEDATFADDPTTTARLEDQSDQTFIGDRLPIEDRIVDRSEGNCRRRVVVVHETDPPTRVVASAHVEAARRYGLDAGQNVDAGVRYLRGLLLRYGGDVEHALAAYNAGPGAVDKYNGVPPYRETRKYVLRVLYRYRQRVEGRPLH
jgi:hypothetical protein